jgi:hypothetical protein
MPVRRARGELSQCSRRCARPTGGSHALTTKSPAQRFKGAKRRAAPRRIVKSAASVERRSGCETKWERSLPGLRRYCTSCLRSVHLPYGHFCRLRSTPIGQGRRRGDALIVGHYVDGVRGHSISQEVDTQQPVRACNESTPRILQALAKWDSNPCLAPPRRLRPRNRYRTLLPRTSQNSSSTRLGE